jgi:hypothetical protein
VALEVVVLERSAVSFLQCAGEIDAPLDLVPLCAEHGTNRVLVDESSLPEGFFDLSSGWAGEFLQKMQNYGIRVAAVLPSDREYTARFLEFAGEARRGQQFRTFDDREEAEKWLTSGE